MLRALKGLMRPRGGRRPSLWGPRLEQLEDRSVPAGNVLALQSGNLLTLVGDGLGNSVRLLPGGQPGEVVVQGAAGTTVNGAGGQTFTGVEDLIADLGGGDDTLRAEGLVLSVPPNPFGPSASKVLVDGSAGDDRIELIDTTIHAGDFVDVQIYGERVTAASGETTGNDTVRLIGTRVTSGAFVSVRIFGETNDGGVVTGGNDTIAIADSAFIASGGFFHSVAVEVYGETNTGLGNAPATVGGGNDSITVKNTAISAASDAPSFGNSATLMIVGDLNDARGFDPASKSGGGDAAATIGGGNDTIAVRNTTVTDSGPNFGTSQAALTVAGDRTSAAGFPGTATAAIGGGNDSITVADSVVSSTGASSNQTLVDVTGEDVQAVGSGGVAAVATVGGGSDAIAVRNVTADAAGPFADSAVLVVRGESVTAFGAGVGSVGAGDDKITLHNVQLPGGAVDDFRAVIVEAGPGDDRVDIIDSAARFFTVHLGDGDDELTFNGNFVGQEAFLDGGPGFDRLKAHDNTGLVIWSGFEEESVTP